ncbi:MAG: hypothetical protein ACLGH3_10200 [Actinomycetota bacterium]
MRPSRLILAALSFAVLVPQTANAAIDLRCSGTTFTSAINGVVEDALGQRLPGLTVELYTTNRQLAFGAPVTTNANGEYLICAGDDTGARHGTFDVHVVDRTNFPVYSGSSQAYTTYLSPATGADFTAKSGSPIRYMLGLEITPDALNTQIADRTVTYRIRSKAPSATAMTLSMTHTNSTITVPFTGTEAGGPSLGGWNIWEHTETVIKGTRDRLHWASARGWQGTTRVTEEDTEFYVFDSVAPLLGTALPTTQQCGAGVVANGMSPQSPPGTTNDQPIVTLGACDMFNDGAKSGLDPFNLGGEICLDADMTIGCQPIEPILDTLRIIWFPKSPLTVGQTYYLRFMIADRAGNLATNPTGYPLAIVDRGGQVPVFTALAPGDLGAGTATSGIVIGSSLTTPTSYPTISFRVLDADGQMDLLPGTLSVRVWYIDDRTLVYKYDPTVAPNAYDSVSKKGGATFDLSSGLFRATGYPLQGKPPGRYSATASVMDRGGNFNTISWQWILAGAV